jgi:hypothetical protein
MSKYNMTNHIKEMIAPLTPVRLSEIKQPKTLEEGRLNLNMMFEIVKVRSSNDLGAKVETD